MIRLSARGRRRLIKLGSVFVLLFAVMPQVLYLGHPSDGGNDDRAVRTMPPGHEHHEQAAAEHANHCHVGPKGCAASDGAVHFASFDTAIQVSDEAGTTDAVDTDPLSRAFALWQRPEKPPQPI